MLNTIQYNAKQTKTRETIFCWRLTADCNKNPSWMGRKWNVSVPFLFMYILCCDVVWCDATRHVNISAAIHVDFVSFVSLSPNDFDHSFIVSWTMTEKFALLLINLMLLGAATLMLLLLVYCWWCCVELCLQYCELHSSFVLSMSSCDIHFSIHWIDRFLCSTEHYLYSQNTPHWFHLIERTKANDVHVMSN